MNTLISVDEYLRTSFHPDCDFVEGVVLERNTGKRKHAYAQGEIASWFNQRKNVQKLAKDIKNLEAQYRNYVLYGSR